MLACLRKHQKRGLCALSILMVSALIGACGGASSTRDGDVTRLPDVNKIVVMGFSPALTPGDPSNWAKDPITGAVFWAEPVLEEVAMEMTDILFDKMVEGYGYSLVSPGQARGAFSEILASDQGLKLDPLGMVQEIGKSFSADGVLVGRIYRWQVISSWYDPPMAPSFGGVDSIRPSSPFQRTCSTCQPFCTAGADG
jgi:hypothetical protein